MPPARQITDHVQHLCRSSLSNRNALSINRVDHQHLADQVTTQALVPECPGFFLETVGFEPVRAVDVIIHPEVNQACAPMRSECDP